MATFYPIWPMLLTTFILVKTSIVAYKPIWPILQAAIVAADRTTIKTNASYTSIKLKLKKSNYAVLPCVILFTIFAGIRINSILGKGLSPKCRQLGSPHFLSPL
jgi:hypothetical protein